MEKFLEVKEVFNMDSLKVSKFINNNFESYRFLTAEEAIQKYQNYLSQQDVARIYRSDAREYIEELKTLKEKIKNLL